jgi:threonylcarbamoyladenosine tRNA methylthiotransferase MtaB
MAESLEKLGYELGSKEDLDLIVLNTCAVTSKAGSKALQILRRLRRENPRAKIVSIGCLAQAEPDELIKYSDLVLGNFQKDTLASKLLSPNGTIDISVPKVPIALSSGTPKTYRTRAFHRIQDGCTQRCAFCIIPSLRGAEKSLAPDRVIADLKAYRDKGIKEIVLTGIHLGRWGWDHDPKGDLTKLLELIDKSLKPNESSFRVRLSSLELKEAQLILDSFNKYPWLARQLHIPLQSGSDKILKLMHRPYTSSLYLETVSSFRKKYKYMSLGTDVMVGFPGEKEEDFVSSLEFVKKSPINHLHIFPFSARYGTSAFNYPGKVPAKEIRKRAGAFKAVDSEKRLKFYTANLGRKELALVENSPEPKTLRQRVITGNYIQALLPEGSNEPSGELIKVKLIGIASYVEKDGQGFEKKDSHLQDTQESQPEAYFVEAKRC